MSVSNKRLLEGIEQTLSALSTSVADPALLELIQSSKFALDELFVRDERAAVRDAYASGRRHLTALLAAMPALPTADPLRSKLAALPGEIADEADWAACDRAMQDLLALCEQASATKAPSTQTQVAELFAWEADSYRFAGRPARAVADAMEAREDKVLDFIRRADSTYRDAKMNWFKRLPGGFSKQTVIFEISTAAHGDEQLVLRGEGPVKLLDIKGQDVAREFHLLRYLHARGLRIAEPLWLQADESPRYLISRRASGALRGTALEKLQPMSDELVTSMASELARVHALPLDFGDPDFAASHLGGRRPATRAEAVANALHEWTDYWFGSVRRHSPTMRTAIDWLYANIPDDGKPPTLVHADCGPNNILIENDRVSAILDWEISHLGDPAADVSWVLFSMGTQDERDRFIAQYARASGTTITPFSIKFYEIMAGVKLVIALFEAQEQYQRAPFAEVKLCKLGLPFLQGPLAKLGQAMREADLMARPA